MQCRRKAQSTRKRRTSYAVVDDQSVYSARGLHLFGQQKNSGKPDSCFIGGKTGSPNWPPPLPSSNPSQFFAQPSLRVSSPASTAMTAPTTLSSSIIAAAAGTLVLGFGLPLGTPLDVLGVISTEAVSDLRIGLAVDTSPVGTVHLRRSGSASGSAGSAGSGVRAALGRYHNICVAARPRAVASIRERRAAARRRREGLRRLKRGHSRCFARGGVLVVRVPTTRRLLLDPTLWESHG